MSERRTLMIVCALAAVALGATAALRPAWRASKAWRAERLVAESQTFAREKSFDVALQKAQAAFLLDRDAPAVVRNFADMATQQHPPAALPLWQRLLTFPESAEADFAAATALATNLERFDLAYEWLDLWPRRLPAPSLARDQARARLLLAVNDRAGFREHLARWRRDGLAPIPDDVLLLEARVQLATPESTERAAAVRQLLDLGQGNNAVALDALVTYLGLTDEPEPMRADAAGKILSHPRATPAHVVVARLAQSRTGGDVESDLQDAVANLVRTPPDQLRQQAFAALLAAGRADLVLKQVTPAGARAESELLTTYLEACLRAGKPDEVLALTAGTVELPVSPAVGLVYRAQAYAARYDTANATASLRRAIAVATEQDLLLVERAATSGGDATLALEYYEHLGNHPRLGPLARAGALGPAYALKDEATVRRLLVDVDLAAVRPSFELVRRAVYLMLVENVRSDDALDAAEAAFSDRGGDVASRLLLAFANARHGRGERARELLSTVEATALNDTPARLIYYSVVGTPHPGAPLPADARLLPSEQRLLAQAGVIEPRS